MQTRLDVVVKLRERDEEQALERVAEAQRKVVAAWEKVRVLEAQMEREDRIACDAESWALVDAAHARALLEARKAKREAERMQADAEKVRQLYAEAYQRAEVVRRLAETRRQEMKRDIARNEDKAMDEAASMLWFRQAG
jgi:flagellar export protein FliJ